VKQAFAKVWVAVLTAIAIAGLSAPVAAHAADSTGTLKRICQSMVDHKYWSAGKCPPMVASYKQAAVIAPAQVKKLKSSYNRLSWSYETLVKGIGPARLLSYDFPSGVARFQYRGPKTGYGTTIVFLDDAITEIETERIM
jgi:hypothetical protein